MQAPIAVPHACVINEGLHLSFCSRLYAAVSTDIIGQTGALSDKLHPQLNIAIWEPL